MKTVTVCLLNWKRPDNIRRIIPTLHSQSLKPKIFLWDNSGGDDSFDVDWLIRSSENMGCWPRWFMAQQATTTHIMSLDDDLCPNTSTLIEQLLTIYDNSPGIVLGPYGRLLTDQEYGNCPYQDHEELCDLVLGRLMFMRTDVLKRHKLPFSDPLMTFSDDIAVCGLMASGEAYSHRACPLLQRQLTELPAPFAVSARPELHAARNAARRQWFKL